MVSEESRSRSDAGAPSVEDVGHVGGLHPELFFHNNP